MRGTGPGDVSGSTVSGPVSFGGLDLSRDEIRMLAQTKIVVTAPYLYCSPIVHGVTTLGGLVGACDKFAVEPLSLQLVNFVSKRAQHGARPFPHYACRHLFSKFGSVVTLVSEFIAWSTTRGLVAVATALPHLAKVHLLENRQTT